MHRDQRIDDELPSQMHRIGDLRQPCVLGQERRDRDDPEQADRMPGRRGVDITAQRLHHEKYVEQQVVGMGGQALDRREAGWQGRRRMTEPPQRASQHHGDDQ